MSYRNSKLFSAVVPIVATFLPLRTPPTMSGRRTVKRTIPAQRNWNNRNRPYTATTAQRIRRQDKPTIGRRRRRRTNQSTGNNTTTTHADVPKPGKPRKKKARPTGNKRRRGQLQQPNTAGRAHMDHRTTPDGLTTGGHDTGEPTQRTGRAPVATRPPRRTGRPPQTSEQTETTTKTMSGYTGAGCSAINRTTHGRTIRQLTQPGTDQTAAQRRPDNEQTARKAANSQRARHARVETGTASHGLATT